MKNLTLIFVLILALTACSPNSDKEGSIQKLKTSLTKAELRDKIKGGWAGQVIGCTFGGPTEFKFSGTMIQDYQPIKWDKGSCMKYYKNGMGLYDDVYMDLTFVDVFEKKGLDAPASAHAEAFAHAPYSLWHANQAARYNILNGIMPPESGYWENNPHSDDIDFQIEADFAGLMSPGMTNTAAEICDKVGHIMNYGDGWYGGVYVAAMYSLAFVSNDIHYIVEEALKAIPKESEFYQCIHDVTGWNKQYPDDWKQTWFEAQRKWSSDRGCPNGVFQPFDIDAKINAAYIVIGLLYGDGDYGKTLEIATRCGQDSDCNPASAGGILGVMIGYSNIPEYWKEPLYPVEDMKYEFPNMSLNDVYELGTKHALELLGKNGADVENESIEIPIEKITPVRLEVGFKGHYPIDRFRHHKSLNHKNTTTEFEFEGNGFVLNGAVNKIKEGNAPGKVMKLEMTLDGGEPEEFLMPYDYKRRRPDIVWKYNLPEKRHKVTLKLLNPDQDYAVQTGDFIVYSSKKPENTSKSSN